MFTKKITEWSVNSDNSEQIIEEFFLKNKFLDSKFEKNHFNGFLIDYEFLLLKKNYNKYLKIDSKKNLESESNFKNENIKSQRKNDGMIRSTIFTLNSSSLSNISTHSKLKSEEDLDRSCAGVWIKEEDRNPLVFDYIIEYASKYSLYLHYC